MNIEIQNILSQSSTKTAKIQALILFGLTRTEIAALVANGNYGFVQNVYTAMKRNGKLNTIALLNFTPKPFDKRFGIEIEAYNVNKSLLSKKLIESGINVFSENYNHNTCTYWKIVNDSSIDGSNGFELVSPVLEGLGGLEQVKIVCDVLRQCNAYINKSCGLHIHFDASNLTLKNWKNIYKNYGGFENEIDSLMPQSRRANSNKYCRSLKSIVNLDLKLEAAKSLAAIANIFNNTRYFKINPISYARHQTIEFRQHSGTIEFEKVQNWVTFLHNLVDYSADNLATDFTFDGFSKFNQQEITNYYHNRKQDLI
jgi:hypothetical protein